MSNDHDAARTLLGAYVLGGLDDADQRDLDAHLRGCGECRAELAHFAPVPALLHRLPSHPGASEASTSDSRGTAQPSPSPERLDSLLRQVRASRTARRRHTRTRWMAAAAALVAVVALGLGVLIPRLSSDEPVGRTTRFTATADNSTTGRAVLTAKPWGTSVAVKLDSLPPNGPVILQVTGVDGHTEQAATWGPTPNGTAQVVGASSIPLTKVSSMTVLDHHGRILATARLT